MSNIKIFDHSMPVIGYIARTTTQGDEFDMVNRYISHVVERYGRLKKKNIAIFIEPQIDSGYPDIVIVEYYAIEDKQWNESRAKLTNTDLKILFQIQLQKNTSIPELSELLGFSITDIEKSIAHLSDSNLIHLSKTKKYIRNVSLQSYCHVNRIISIEAKIDKWTGAIQQAEKNIWFSTESYILMNKESCNNSILEMCKERGIGIILVNGKIQKVMKSDSRKFPVSYASFQFNEWIQKADHCGGM